MLSESISQKLTLLDWFFFISRTPTIPAMRNNTLPVSYTLSFSRNDIIFWALVWRKNGNLFQDSKEFYINMRSCWLLLNFDLNEEKCCWLLLNGMEILWRKSKRGPPSNSASNATWWIENNRLTGFQDRMESTRISNSFWSWNAICTLCHPELC